MFYTSAIRELKRYDIFSLDLEESLGLMVCESNVGGLVVTFGGRKFNYNPRMLDTDAEIYINVHTSSPENNEVEPTAITYVKNLQTGLVHIGTKDGQPKCGSHISASSVEDTGIPTCERCVGEIYKWN